MQKPLLFGTGLIIYTVIIIFATTAWHKATVEAQPQPEVYNDDLVFYFRQYREQWGSFDEEWRALQTHLDDPVKAGYYRGRLEGLFSPRLNSLSTISQYLARELDNDLKRVTVLTAMPLAITYDFTDIQTLLDAEPMDKAAVEQRLTALANDVEILYNVISVDGFDEQQQTYSAERVFAAWQQKCLVLQSPAIRRELSHAIPACKD